MKIPSGLQKILTKNRESNTVVSSVIGCLEPIYEDNKMPFFPEYTDHGIKHVEGVIQTAWTLMSSPARQVVTFRDAEVLILSCIFHDLAMHLSMDGFVSLVSQKIEWRVVGELGDEPWEKLWLDFTAEARRFDGRMLKRIFGTPEPVQVPNLDPETWDGKQLKLIGEFVRRHHHRLAHQIIINGGMPGPDGQKLELPQIDKVIADLIGLVARSHGLPIRENLGYLDKYHARQQYQNIHCVFLMVLLRVSDYLQVDSDRAPKEILAIKRLRSPVSQREWRSHAAIKDIKPGEDVESLFIQALPEDVETYLRLRQLLDSIQYELDCSWAVLGEVYSRYTKEKWDRLGLSLRRVTSNLDDLDEFSKKVSYVPCRAAFDTAGAELMNLLIEPLYGKSPVIAIRELVQNAVDAIREFNEYIKLNDDVSEVERPEQSADVLISLTSDNDGILYLKVEDKGIGMTPDILKSYFLKAGASIRSSLDWRKTFENERGESRILRSGRFGIGVFAVLLLGEKVHVSSRHISAESGVEFEAALADEFVEFHKIDRPVGTSISVRIDEETALELLENPKQWAWYVLEEPVVERNIQITNQKPLLKYIQKSRNKKEVEAKKLVDEMLEKEKFPHRLFTLPGAEAELPADWHRIEHKDYQDLHWTYSNIPFLTCNGIIVVDEKVYFDDLNNQEIGKCSLRSHLNDGLEGNISFELPRCSCFDPDGKLPLSLQRTGVTRKYQFVEELQEAVLHDFLAYVLVHAPTTPIRDQISYKTYYDLRYPGLYNRPTEDIIFAPLVGTSSGITIAESWLVRQNVGNAAIGLFQFEETVVPGEILKNNLILSTCISRFSDFSEIAYSLINEFLGFAESRGRRYLMTTDMNNRINSSVMEYWMKEYFGNQTSIINTQDGYWVDQSIGDCSGDEGAIQQIIKEVPTKNLDWDNQFIVAQWFFDENKMPKQSALAKHWMDIIGQAAIPYDLKEREKTLAPAYKKLEKYIQKWRMLKKAEKLTRKS